MAAVTFRRNASSRMVDAWCERTWQIPATGDAGEAVIRLPYSSAAASTTYIDPAGGSWVEIANEGGCGAWIGIIREIQYNTAEIQLTCAQPWVLFGDRILHWETTQRHAAPVGYLAGKILREAMSGLPWFWERYLPGEATDPMIRNYEFNGQDAWSALQDLMDQCNSELIIDAETGEVTWGGALSGDLRQTTLLIADGNLRNWSYRASGQQRAAEVMVKRGNERFSLYSGAGAVAYPGQVTVTAATGQSLYNVAAAELPRRAGAAISISGAVTSDLWTIRERDFVRVIVSQAGFSGKEHPCRVLGRRVSDDSPLMQLTLQVIDESVGVRVAPPMRGGSTGTSGAKGRGSFAQRQRAAQRAGWHAWLRDS